MFCCLLHCYSLLTENILMSKTSKDLQDWNRIAGSYGRDRDESNDRVYQQVKTVLWDSLGDIQGLEVLDLGCGSGWFTKELHLAGAKVLGIDGSAELLKIAKSSYPDLEFFEQDLTRRLHLNREFDRIVALMVLMDIPELDLLMSSVRAALKPNGKFIFTIPHPCFFNMKSDFDEETGQWFRKVTGYHQPEVWRIESFGGHNHYHRGLTYYFDNLRANRFAVTRLYEPEHIATTAKTEEHMIFLKNIPVFILIEAIPL
jgi:SAM-dependent methyltransferase